MLRTLGKAMLLTLPLWGAVAVIGAGLTFGGPSRVRAGDEGPGAGEGAASAITPRFETGEQRRYSIRLRTSSVVVTPQVRTDRWDQRLKVVVTTTVESLREGGGAVVAVTFDGIELQVADPEKRWRYDSDAMHARRQEDAIAEAVKGIVGGTIRLDVDGAGRIVAVRDTEAMLREPDLRRFSERIVGESAARTLFSRLFRPPGAPASATPGESWEVVEPFESSQAPGVEFAMRWTLERVEGGTAHIGITGEARLSASASGSVVPSVGGVRGGYTWDLGAGRLESSEINCVFGADVGEGPDARSLGGEIALTISRAE